MKICVLIILILSTQNIYSQEISWEYMSGPEIGTVRDIQEVNGIIYINTENGVFRSSDHGESWHHLHGYGSEQVFAVSQSNDIVVQFINWDSGIARCSQKYLTNGGIDWEELQVPVYDDKCWIVKAGFDASGALHLLRLYDEDSIKVYTTDDFGNTWNYNISEFKEQDFVNMKIEILKNGNIIIGGYYETDDDLPGQIYIGKDSGREWEVFEGIPFVLCWEYLSENEIFAGTGYGLFYTSDRGNNWTKNIFDRHIEDIFVTEKGIYVVTVGGLFLSTNMGSTWDNISKEYFYTLCQSANGDLFGGNELGFHISTDQGRTWRRSNKGFSAANVMDFTFDKKGNVYVCDRGVYKSSDDGETWHLLGLEGKNIRNILVSEEGYIYAPGGGGGMYRSTDEGKNWEVFEGGNGGTDIIETRRGDILLGSSYHAIRRSTDKGQTWQSENLDFGPVCYAYNNQGELFAGFSRGLFYRSTDDGYTWEQRSEEDLDDREEIYQIVFSSKDPVGYANCYVPKLTYISSLASWRTKDNGNTWEKASVSYLLAFDSVGNLWTTFLRSTNLGDTWTSYPEGLMHSRYITIGVSPKGYIYLGAYRGGIYRTKNPIVSVEDDNKNQENYLSLSPNPADHNLTIDFSIEIAGTACLNITDMMGRTVLKLPNNFYNSGMQREIIDVSTLSPGIYILTLRTDRIIRTAKLIVR